MPDVHGSAPGWRAWYTVCWLLKVPATCKRISGTDLHNFTCCHNEIQLADQTIYLTQSQYTDTGPISPSDDPIMPGAWQGSHWYDSTPKKIPAHAGFEPGSSALEADTLTTRPTRRSARPRWLSEVHQRTAQRAVTGRLITSG